MLAHTVNSQGMANPPRKAKRLRELASRESPVEPSIYPPTSSTTGASTSLTLSPTPRRRGRKPVGPLSKSARDQLRKTNHSVIEKRRREKINEALAALRELVPHENQEAEKVKEEKEFKLEILVRTVEYLRKMVDKVKRLEDRTCERCGKPLPMVMPASPLLRPEKEPLSLSGKRKRPDHEDNDSEEFSSEDEGLGYADITPALSRTRENPGPSHQPPRLPSISSWMSSSPVDTTIYPHPLQLPTPPQSAPLAPMSTLLPMLKLPSPVGFDPSYPNRGLSLRAEAPPLLSPNASPLLKLSCRDRDVPDLPLDGAPQLFGKSAGTSIRPPYIPPQTSSVSDYQSAVTNDDRPGTDRPMSGGPISPWTRDDQTAASLLLNISSRGSHLEPQERKPMNNSNIAVLEAQTPSSVLGMGEGGEGSAT